MSGSEDLFGELRRLSARVQTALEGIQLNARFNTLATRDIKEARQRLAYVIEQTDGAAHRTLALIELSEPLVDVLAGGEGADCCRERERAARQLRENLSEILMAQSFQDLTGQVLRGLMTLVGEVETVLDDLIRLSGGRDVMAAAPGTGSNAHGFGPAIPGLDAPESVVSDQGAVDSLLSGLGL